MPVPTPSEIPRILAANAFGVGDLVDTKTAAKVLGLHNHHTLEVWRSTKRYQELRFIRIGRAIRYSLSDLKRFLHANSVGGAPVERVSPVTVGEAR